MKPADPDFVEAMASMFGDDAEESFGEKNVARLREMWDRAILAERKHVFEWMRADAQESRCDDKEWLYQSTWVIGNGTYRTKPSLEVPLSWLEVEEVVLIDDDIRNQLMVTRLRDDIGVWEVKRKDAYDPPTVARIFVEENEEGAASHRVELVAAPFTGAGQTRIYQTWEQCIHGIVAWIRARE